MTTKILKSPFPYPGGKSRIADQVWQRFGNVRNYIEPFAGSLAVLLRRPAEHFDEGYRIETTNDINHYIVNFWRSVAKNPELVAKYADWPVSEADLHARHKWLVRSAESKEWRAKVANDPNASNAKLAGWWVWGLCCWIGGGWCQEEPKTSTHKTKSRPSLRSCSEGVMLAQGRPQLADAYDIGRGVNSGAAQIKRPNFSYNTIGGGVNSGTSATDHKRRIGFNGGAGYGVNQNGTLGTVKARREWLTEWIMALADRLRLVRTCYGHWSRICDSNSTLTRLGRTGVFIDAPYPTIHGVTGEKSRDDHLYTGDKDQDLLALRDEIMSWCIKWGNNPKISIAVCGYEGDGYESLLDRGWFETIWHASGGYANQRRAGKKKSANAKRERIWWSTACKRITSDKNLFSSIDDRKSKV